MTKFMAYNVHTHEIIATNDLHLLYDMVRLDTRSENYKGIVWVVFGNNAKAVFSFGKYANTDYKIAHCVAGDIFPQFFPETRPVFEWVLKNYDNGYSL